MIRIERGSEPKYLKSRTLDLANEKLIEFYESNNRSQKRYNFPFNSEIDKFLKDTLHERFYGKCGYCEIKIKSPDFGFVDRFRPHNGLRDKKKYYSDLYWWLVFDWNNLIYSCKECNQYKSNYFPIKGNRVFSKSEDLKNEKKLLLDPCNDNVEDHLFFEFSNGNILSNTDEGEQTIELLNLNRTTLLKKRAKAISNLAEITDRFHKGSSYVRQSEINYFNQIFDKDPSIEFLFSKYEYLIHLLDVNPFIRKYILEDDDKYEKHIEEKLGLKRVKRQNKKFVKSDFFPLEYIKIRNFKSISNLRLNFPDNELDEFSWLALLGENGLGKSSILQAICIGLNPIFESGDDIISKLIKNDKNEATITIKQRDSEILLVTKLTREQNEVRHNGKLFSPLIGYGSVRLLPNKEKETSFKSNKVFYQNLFDPSVTINDVIPWISNIYIKNRTMFDSIAYSLKKLLPEEMDDNLIIKSGQLIFEKSKASFDSLSDGYKNTITLALDIIKILSDGETDIDKLTGIVIIDELGNQLHPRWQMQVVSQLRSVFPRINFIVSTHHPLCLRGLKEGESVVMKKGLNKKEIEIIQNLPSPEEFRVDQLLTSEFFGLHTTIDPDMESRFNEYYHLLADSKLTVNEGDRLRYLKNDLIEKKHFGNSLREEIMYSVIDELLAKELNLEKTVNRNKLKEETIRRVREIWTKNGIIKED